MRNENERNELLVELLLEEYETDEDEREELLEEEYETVRRSKK